MTRYLISILGLSALFLLHGCATAPEPEPQPAPPPRAEPVSKPPTAVTQPAVIRRPADTGTAWVTDTSDLKSRHEFQLAQYIVEVDEATRYDGGSVADIEVGARLRAVGVYRDDVVVADTIYIERSAGATPTQTLTGDEEPGATASQRQAPGAPQAERGRRGSEHRAEDAEAGRNGPGVTKPKASEHAARTGGEKAKTEASSAEPTGSVTAQKQQSKTMKAPKAATPADASDTGTATQTPSAETVKATPKPTESDVKLAKAGSGMKPAPAKSEPSEKEAIEPAPPSPPASATRDFSHLVFDDRILPMSLDHGWMLDRQPDLVDGTTRCVLLSPSVTIFDGYYPAKMWLRVNPARAWVTSDSNLDTSYPKQGLRVDGAALAPFAEQLVNEQTAYTEAPVLPAMAEGHTLTVALGFWPTWPKTQTQTASLDLAGFANAHAALRACSKQQQAARK